MRVIFVADPDRAPPAKNIRYARPDDPSDNGESWRNVLLRYNHNPGDNPLQLCPANELYLNEAYRQLVDRFGITKTYILSAGWGLIRASFLTPYYDITFSKRAEPYKRRKKSDTYSDLCMLPDDTEEPMVFFGGQDYVPLFCRLTHAFRVSRTVFYNSDQVPDAPGCSLKRFVTRRRTNWHYECANAFLRREIEV